MAVKRDSLRAERDFYAPMTGGTQIRYSEAPMGNRDTYSSQVKSRLSEIGQVQRRAAPIISAIKTRMKKTDDPFTQVGQQKSYAPQQEENQIGAQIDAQIDAAASQAEEVVSEGVAQAETAVQEFKTKSSKRQQERRLQRQADLKEARDERAALKGDMKKLFARDQKRYGNTVPEGSFGSGSKKTIESSPGSKVDTRPRHSEGGPGDQPKVSKFEKPKVQKPKGGQGGLPLGATTLRQGEKPTGPAVKLTNYKDIRKKRLDAKKAALQAKKEGTTKAVNASSFQQKNLRGGRKDESARPKPRQTVASLPSNYKKTEAAAFAKARSYQDSKAKGQAAAKATNTPTKPKAGSFNISAAGRKQAEANKAEKKVAAVKVAKKVKDKSEQRGKGFAPKATVSKPKPSISRAKSRPTRGTGTKTRRAKAKAKANAQKRKTARKKSTTASKRASRGARGGTSSRSRGGTGSKGGSTGGSKRSSRGARGGSSSRSRGGTSRGGARTNRRRSRRRGRRCDILLKFDISLLTNNNLRHDELAEVAYFVRALREVEL